jgi:uncharacterized cupin superfamily protein
VTDVVNLDELEPAGDPADPEGYRCRSQRIGPLVGATRLGMSVYDLPPGQSICPYHYELGDEEWLLVLDGRPLVRTPAGEEELAPGDVVCFPEGEEGAHKVTNRGDGSVRVAMLSTKRMPAVAVYPDSNKVGIWPPGKLFRLADEVGYWEGETTP